MFKRILTLALNPSLDTTVWLDNLTKGTENIAQEERTDASGKSVNIARVLEYYGIGPKLVLLLGNHNQARFREQLDKEHINYDAIEVEGYTRENLSMVEYSGAVTRIIRKGFVVPYEAVEAVQQAIDRYVQPGCLVMISGALPDGITPRVLQNICAHVRKNGGEISLDTRSATLADIKNIKPWIIKPNKDEFKALFGEKIDSQEDIIAAAKELVAAGVPNCLVSLGGDGALYVNKDIVLKAEVPEVVIKSTVSAGDSMLSGFIKARMAGQSDEQCLATAAAFGTAACMIDGSTPPHKITVGNIVQQVVITQL